MMLVAAINNLGLNLNAGSARPSLSPERKAPYHLPLTSRLLNLIRYLPSNTWASISQMTSGGPNTLLLCVPWPGESWAISIESFINSHDSSTLLILYKAFVRPILEHGAPVWDPHLTKDIQAIESVQRFATKICLKNSSMSYSDWLKLLGLDSLYTRRKGAKLCLLYKIVHSLSAQSFPLTPFCHNYSNSSHDFCFRMWRAHTNHAVYPFYNSSIRAWNELLQEVVSCNTLPALKK